MLNFLNTMITQPLSASFFWSDRWLKIIHIKIDVHLPREQKKKKNWAQM